MKNIRTVALAAALLGGLVAASGQASATIPNGLSALAQEQASDVQNVRLRRAFGFYRPWPYRPRRAFGFYRPRPVFGFYRPWWGTW